MAGALLSAIVERLGPFISSEFKLTVTVKKEVQKLETNFRTIQAVLNDAEKRQLKEDEVKLWVDKVEDVLDEADNVLDEWNTVMIKAGIEKQQKEFEEEEKAETSTAKKRKVWLITPNFNFPVPEFFQHRDIAHKVKDLNAKLGEINKEKQRYRFEVSEPIEEVFQRPRTTNHVDVSEIYGRDSIKDDLVDKLLGNGSEERSPHLISLVGMGGIGKTTLAQLAYNDPKVTAHFEIKGWVCVSNPFVQCKVAKDILESIEGQSSNLTALESLLNRICDKVRGKKFFLVFDDVWTKDYAMWKPFRDALKNCGSQNSRILVTTRKEEVARMMESANNIIKLDELSEEDCWSVFSEIAFFDKDPQQREQLEDFGRQISKKCKGLPLAAKTLGSLMRFKKNIKEWKNVLNSNLWELEDVERGLFAPLLLSYYDLSSPLKRCFSYCAIFPKDHVFDVDELVYMWTAHGFVESKENMEVEIKAREYFENLVIRSFFQECEKDEYYYETALSTMSTRYKMHDIVHDFAQSITKARHLGYSTASQFPPSIDRSKNLRTVIFFKHSDYNMSSLVQNFTCLRVLTLQFSMELPDTIGNLIHLRYLDLSFHKADLLYGKSVFPETICNLCNLQFLMLNGSARSEPKILPQGIGKLINLRLLTGSNLVIPREIGRLMSLRTLNTVLISDEDSKRCKLEGLKNLKNLIHLRDLSLVFIDLSLTFNKGVCIAPNDRRIESNVILNALELPQDLEKLRIRWYKGATMSPIWLASLTNLKKLYLICVYELLSLPPLGMIRCLELLYISSARRLKKVGVEFLGIESENKKEDIKIFPNLKYLEFSDLGEWEEWIGGTRGGGKEDEDCITIMPRLEKLIIRHCRKLKSLPDFLRTTPLKELEIKDCPIIKERCQRETGEYWHNISHIPIIKLPDDPEDMMRDRDSDSEAASDSDTDRERAEDEEDASDFVPEENGSEEEEIDEEDEDEDGGKLDVPAKKRSDKDDSDDDDDGGEDDERPSKR